MQITHLLVKIHNTYAGTLVHNGEKCYYYILQKIAPKLQKENYVPKKLRRRNNPICLRRGKNPEML